MLLCFSTWLINCFNADKYYLENGEWLNSSSLSLASFPAPHLNDCRPCPSSFLMLGSCCQLSSPLAHDCLILSPPSSGRVPFNEDPNPNPHSSGPSTPLKNQTYSFSPSKSYSRQSSSSDTDLSLTPKTGKALHPPFVFPLKRVLFLLSFPPKSPVSTFQLKVNGNDQFSY